jgi:hypothetical protein
MPTWALQWCDPIDGRGVLPTRAGSQPGSAPEPTLSSDRQGVGRCHVSGQSSPMEFHKLLYLKAAI